MPRAIDSDLLDCLERANPYTEYRIEISQPDTSQVLRRQDQYLNAPSLVSMAPALSLTASPRGALILTPATTGLVSFAGVGSSYDLNGESQQRRYKGVAWTMDPSFSRATLKSITAKIERVPLGPFFFDADIECQIFRITKTPGVKQANVGTAQYQSVAWTEYTFTPLLSPAPTLKASSQIWDGANRTTLNFDLTNWNLTLENTPSPAITPDQVGELPEFLIVVRLAKAPAGTGHFKWLVDNASARTIAGTGTFERVWWARDSDDQQWVRNAFADVPNIALNVDFYPVTGQGVFLIDQGAVPGAASTGRVDFQRSLPSGTSVTAEISTAGAGGPWTPVKHGDVIVTRQQQYHMRVTLNADAARTSTPQVNSLGVEFRIPRDVSVEGIPDLPTREINFPWLKASIPEGKLRVVRTGSRDFLDVATVLGSTAATPQLEADIYLASRHPSITRDKWFRLERMRVTGRVPSATSEEFTLLSYASRLKRKIPQKVESINSVHVVQGGSTAAQLIVAPGLPGTTIAGNEYDGQGYYMRVRTTAAPNTRPGFVATIQGNTSTDRLDFAPALTEALVAGDVIEVHSGVYKTQPVTLVDIDPADAWDTILSLLAIPPEKIGIGSLPRGGKPPRVTDIAPGDAVTQAKRRITIRLSEEEPGDELLDQISSILGGVTLEIDSQIVYVQIIPLIDLSGAVTVPLPPPSAVFDRRDIVSLQTPPGLEKRATIINCAYGTPATAADPNAFPSKSTTAVDGDALLWLAQQDLEDYGTADVPDNIARWLYNSSDAGLYLAAVFPAQFVKCLSTGLRVFPMRMTEKHPTLAPGDVVIVGTDQYTDYEPSTQTPIAGPIAIRGVIVRVGSEGRDLSIFVAGLIDNVQQIKGGNAGLLTGLGVIPEPPTLSASFDAAGQLIINSSGDFAVASQKIAWATGATPSAATVRAAAPIAQQLVSGLATGAFYLAGTTVYIAAFAYNGNGVESTPIAAISVTRQGSGTSAPPSGSVLPLNTEANNTTRDLRFLATAGSGGGGVNLTYDIRLKLGFLPETSIASGNGLTLPRDLTVARDPEQSAAGRYILTDTATGLVAIVPFVVPSQRAEVTTIGGQIRFKRTVNFHDGDNAAAGDPGDTTGRTLTTGTKESGLKLVSRLLAKTLPADPDTADSVSNGILKRVVPFAVLRSSDDALMTRVDYVASIGDARAGAVGKRAGILFSEVFDKTPAQQGYGFAGSVQNGTLVNTAGVAQVGTNVYQMNGYEWNVFPHFLPFNPSKLYRIRARYRCTVNASVPSMRAIYIGLQCLDATGAPSNNNGGYNYVCSSGDIVNVATGWREVTGWFKGATNPFASGSVSASADPTAPSPLSVNTSLISPMFAFNYANGASTDGTYQIDYIQIDELDEDASDRTYTVINTGQTFKTAAKESGGKAVNRLFGKTLAADPDNADSVGAGSLKRIPLLGGTDSSGNIDLGGTAWINRYANKIARSSVDATGLDNIVANLTNSSHAGGAMQESGGKAVNRLLGKTLAADPDSLDGAPDGVTYKKIVSVNGSGQITPPSSTPRNRVKATRTAAQSIPNATLTAMNFTGTDAWDSNNLHDPAGGTPSRIVVPSGGDIGVWILTAQISFANNATGLRSLYFYKNGVTRLKRVNAAGINIASVGNYMEITAFDDAPAVNDYYELWVEQTSGIALNASPAGEDWVAATHMW